MAGVSTFRVLLKACKNLRDVIQATEDVYLEVCAGELETFTEAGDMRGWSCQFKGGWRLQGKKTGMVQYIRYEDRNLLRKLEQIRERWK